MVALFATSLRPLGAKACVHQLTGGLRSLGGPKTTVWTKAPAPARMAFSTPLSTSTERKSAKSTDRVTERSKGNPVMEALLSRRTIGDFTDEKVPDMIVTSALEAARWAPNHKLTEPWKFYWLGANTIEAIAKLNSETIEASGQPTKAAAKYEKWRNIKGWIAVTSALSPENSLIEQEDYAATCCSIQNMMLALHSQGVGSKWTTGAVTRTKEIADLIGYRLDEERPVGIIFYGMPAKAEAVSLRRKNFTNVVQFVP